MSISFENFAWYWLDNEFRSRSSHCTWKCFNKAEL